MNTGIKFNTNQRLTIIAISSMLAHTVKSEITITRDLGDGRYAYKDRGKRKEYMLDTHVSKLNPSHTLLFDGWDVPIKRDADVRNDDGSSGFVGNACFNLAATDRSVVIDYIENRNLLGPTSDEVKSKVFFTQIDDKCRRVWPARLLYPDIPSSHAVVQRHKQTQIERDEAEVMAIEACQQ